MSPGRVVAVTVLLVVVGASILRGVADSGDKNPVASVENGAPRGLLALKLLLESRGIAVEARRRTEDPEPSPGAVVIVPPPEASSPTAAEITAFTTHVNAGGVLIVICDDADARTERLRPLLIALGTLCSPADVAIGDTADEKGVGVLPWFARDVRARGLGRVQTYKGGPGVPAMMVGTDALIVVRTMGTGTAVVVGSATVLANDGITQGENAALLLDLVPAGARVVVDQRFHVPRSRTMFAQASSRGVGPIAMMLALGLLVPLSLLTLAPRRGDLSVVRSDDGAPAAEAQARALAALLVRARPPPSG